MNGKKISMLLLWVLFCIWKVVAQDCQPFNIDLKTSIPVTITETDSFIYWNVCKGQTLTFTPKGIITTTSITTKVTPPQSFTGISKVRNPWKENTARQRFPSMKYAAGMYRFGRWMYRVVRPIRL